MRVDVFGPPGVGKSTTLRRLTRALGPSSPWLSDWQARRSCAQRIVRARAASLRRTRLQLALALPKAREVYARLVCQDAQYDAIAAISELSNDFAELAVESVIKSSVPLELRLKSVDDLLHAIGQLAVFSRWLPESPMLLDDASLTHFGTRFGFVDEPKRYARDFCFRMPKPGAAIWFNDEAALVTQRIRERQRDQDKLIPMHSGKSDAELHRLVETCSSMCQAGAEVLRARGVPLLELRPSEAAPHNVDRLQQFLRSLMP